MKKSKVTRSLLAACAVVALTGVMYGCTHSSDDPPAMTAEPDPVAVDMSGVDEDASAAAGTYMIAAGGMHTAGDVTFTCAAGGDACSVTVAADGSATSTGGMVTAAASDAFMANKRADEEEAKRIAAEEEAERLRMAEEERKRMAAEEEERKRNEAMAATAAKLHAGIHEPAADATGTDASDVHAAYNDADAPTTGTAADTLIMVTRGTGSAAGTAVPLSEDKDTTVAALRGWEGKRYHRTTPASEGTYEAMVYSHVGMPTQGDPFNEEYTLATADTATATVHQGEVGVDTSGNGVPARVASSRFTQTAGTMEFTLPTNMVRVVVPGTYHGVSGNYYCTPTDANTKCSAAVAETGFTLAGGSWAFKPGTATARVTSTPDTSYASYGWWLHTAANGDLTASAFVDRKGAVDAASGIDTLNGTATYVGGAVGKYALSSTTGGTNDAGHFTARATLNANFTTNTAATAITGTIDQFVGADGMSRDWSVKLNGSPITDTGGIGEAGDTTDDNAMTVWTIGGTAATAAGEWTGSLQENGDDNVPAIATGTFYSTYGTAGKMIGAFGANKQ